MKNFDMSHFFLEPSKRARRMHSLCSLMRSSCEIQHERRRLRDGQRGGTLIIVMLTLMVLTGLGVVAFRFVRMESGASGYVRTGRGAFHVAEGGLQRTASLVTQQPDYFHRAAYQANSTQPRYEFAVTTLYNDADQARLGTLSFSSVMSRPRLAQTPTLYQVGGSTSNRFAFYTYQFDMVGAINGDPQTKTASAGGVAAIKQLRSDVRIGPITVNQ